MADKSKSITFFLIQNLKIKMTLAKVWDGLAQSLPGTFNYTGISNIYR